MSRLPSLGPHGEGWVALQVVLFVLLALAGIASEPAWTGAAATLTSLLGLALLLGGALLAARGLLDLGRNLTPVPRPRRGAELVETGVYSLVRHPIYGGIIAAAFGWGLIAASPLTLLLALVVGVFFDLKSRREETWLASHYPGYQAYTSRTRRFFPRLY